MTNRRPRRHAQPKTIYTQNGMQMDVSPDIAARLKLYQNGSKRLASDQPFEYADPVDHRFAEFDESDPDQKNPLVAAAEDEAAEDAAERAEMARIQSAEIERMKMKRQAPGQSGINGGAHDEGPIETISPLVADAMGTTNSQGIEDEDDEPPRRSVA